MKVGILTVKLRLPENPNLKGKRQVVKSIIHRVRDRFNVSIAEVGDQDLWQLATMGVTCVANSGPHVNQCLSRVVDFIASSRVEAELLDYEIEILP